MGFAFFRERKKANKCFTYGYGKAEDIAGLIIVFLILFNAVVAAYESISRFFFPQPVEFLGGVIASSIVGFVGLLITIAILKIVRDTGKSVFSRMLDGM
jgi:divalent metal cation (Fe/Co/Zn/Cd) transporter